MSGAKEADVDKLDNPAWQTNRKELLDDLSKKCRGEIIEKTIRFTNDDVPRYLKRLKKSEGLSSESQIIIVK